MTEFRAGGSGEKGNGFSNPYLQLLPDGNVSCAYRAYIAGFDHGEFVSVAHAVSATPFGSFVDERRQPAISNTSEDPCERAIPQAAPLCTNHYCLRVFELTW